MLSHHQNFESDKRIIQCKGTPDQLSQTKNEIDLILKEPEGNLKGSDYNELEAVVVNSIPLAFGIVYRYVVN